jgi:hypothetical protein
MMKRMVVLAALCGVVALASVGTASSKSSYTWHVVKSKSVSGQFAVTAISATIRHPLGLAVRLRGTGVQGHAVWACSKGFSVASWSHSYGGGFHILGHVRGKSSCDVTASVGGRGRVTVQILKLS